METSFEFLERMYLPGYMTLLSADYDKKSGKLVRSSYFSLLYSR